MPVSQSDHQASNAGAQDQPQRGTAAATEKAEPRKAMLPTVAPNFVFAVGDPQEGNLATPINSSTFTRWYVNQLPAYREGMSPFQRGLQVGLSHGFWLLGPFVALGPLRQTPLALLTGLSATIALVVIAALTIAIYAESQPLPPIATLTTPAPPTDFNTPQGWQALARGFLVGGTAGAVFAAIILLIFSL